VILGIRPSDFEGARLGDPAWGRMSVLTSVTEELGSEVHVIFAVDAPPVEHRDAVAVAEDEGGEDAIPVAAGTSMWTARVSSRSGVRPGERLELAVDTANLHFFDAVSGQAIGQN
jgi:multiple sugar transport system ATP-binding protein